MQRGLTVAAKGQSREEEGGWRGEKMWDRGMQREGVEKRKRKEKKKKWEWVSRREGSKREDERVGGRWQEGSMQIAQDLTGIFLDG